MEPEIKYNIQDEASRWTRQFCSQLFDFSRGSTDPEKAMQEYLAIFARQVSKELRALNVKGEALDVFKKNIV